MSRPLNPDRPVKKTKPTKFDDFKNPSRGKGKKVDWSKLKERETRCLERQRMGIDGKNVLDHPVSFARNDLAKAIKLLDGDVARGGNAIGRYLPPYLGRAATSFTGENGQTVNMPAVGKPNRFYTLVTTRKPIDLPDMFEPEDIMVVRQIAGDWA